MASITKGNLAGQVHKALGINTRFTEATPPQVADTLSTINTWMLSQDGLGVRLGWNADNNTDAPDPKQESGLPDWAVIGVVYSCAALVASYFDKQPTPQIQAMASQGMQTILSRTVERQEVQYPNRMPLGQGNKSPYGPNYYTPDDRIRTDNDFLEDEGGSVITTGGF